jgi:hypothetical protein
MCNRAIMVLHDISESGKGWKFHFKKNKTCAPIRLIDYRFDKDGWVEWDQDYGDNHGFCFFLTIKEARRVRDIWNENSLNANKVSISPIEYQRGMVLKEEHAMIPDEVFYVALCKKWRWKP